MKLLFVATLMTASLVAQNVAVVDQSPADSPVSVRGSMTFGSGSVSNCTITGHNNSMRTIVAYVIELHAVLPDGPKFEYNQNHDHFFRDAAMVKMASPPAGQDFDADFECEGMPLKPGTTQPQAAAETTFVQFDDGSIWGKDATVKNAMLQRTEVLAYLNLLQAAYEKGGLDAFGESLQQEPVHKRGNINALAKRQILLDLKDNQQAVKEVNQSLANAQAHESWLK
jgi:hypothetical protein